MPERLNGQVSKTLGAPKARASSNLAPSAVQPEVCIAMDIQVLTKRIKEISDIYAEKFDISRDDNWYVLKLQEEMGELIQSYLMMSGQARKKDKNSDEIKNNFEHEVADILCHILLLADHYGIDLDTVVQKKWLDWKK